MWDNLKLKEICEIKPVKKQVKDVLVEKDQVSFVPMDNLGIDKKYFKPTQKRALGSVYKGYTYFGDNDVLLAKITPCFENGKLGIAKKLINGIGFGSSEFLVFRSKENLFPEYLYYFLSRASFRENGTRFMTGAVGHKRIPLDFIENINIPLPPLEEQKGIVAILDETFAGIDKAIENTEKNLANAKELFESYLNNIFTQKGDGWVETTLGECIDLLTGYAFKSQEYTEDLRGIKLLRGDNILQGYFRWSGVKKWPEEKKYEFEKFLLQENDVVLAMDRTWVKAGLKYAKITQDLLPCLLVQRVARLRAKPILNENFLCHQISSKLFTDYVLSIQTGLGVPHISGKQIQAFSFRIPDYKTQKYLADHLDEILKDVQRLDAFYQQKLTALKELKQSLLQKAFAGELTSDMRDVA